MSRPYFSMEQLGQPVKNWSKEKSKKEGREGMRRGKGKREEGEMKARRRGEEKGRRERRKRREGGKG